MAQGHAATAPDIPIITREEVIRRAGDARLILVNVLPATSFESCRIPGSRNLPVSMIEAHATRVLPDRHADIVIYCGGFT